MFKKKTGPERFAQCAIKEIQVRRYYKDPDSTVDVWYTGLSDEEVMGKQLGYVAILHCPKTQKYSVDSAVCMDRGQQLIDNLAGTAGAAVCSTCTYYNMSAEAVQKAEQTRLTNEAELLRLRTAHTAAEAEYQRALAELEKPHHTEGS